MVTKKDGPEFPFPEDHYLSVPTTARRSHSEPHWVKRVQQALDLEQTGTFDAATRQAVLDFQKRRKLPRTGVVDPDTWAKLPFE